jgi:hypothetical protein
MQTQGEALRKRTKKRKATPRRGGITPGFFINVKYYCAPLGLFCSMGFIFIGLRPMLMAFALSGLC